MPWVTDGSVVVFAHPERAPATQNGVGFASSERLPTPDDVTQWETPDLGHQHMDVVRHDAPLQQSVALPVEPQQGVLDESRDLRTPEMALAPSGVFVARDSAAQFLHAGLFCAPHIAVSDLFAPSLDQFSWEAVREPDRDPLNHAGCVEVRQITSGVAGPANRTTDTAPRSR